MVEFMSSNLTCSTRTGGDEPEKKFVHRRFAIIANGAEVRGTAKRRCPVPSWGAFETEEAGEASGKRQLDMKGYNKCCLESMTTYEDHTK